MTLIKVCTLLFNITADKFGLTPTIFYILPILGSFLSHFPAFFELSEYLLLLLLFYLPPS